MKRISTFLAAIAVAYAILSAGNVYGQLVTISESTLDFGCVEVGSSGTDIITVTNISTDIVAIQASLVSGEFSVIIPDIGSAQFIPAGGTQDYEVEFAPVTAADATATLMFDITSPSPTVQQEIVELVGTGGASNDPIDFVDCILEFFDDSIAGGTLEGTGYCPHRRVRAMRNRIRAIDWLLQHGYYDYAHYVTCTAILRSDGLPHPRDFVQGTNLESLNEQLVTLKMMLE